MSGDVELLIPNVTDLSILCLIGRQLRPNGLQACYNIPNRLGRVRPPTAYICARWPYSHHKLNTVRLRSSEKGPFGLCGSLGGGLAGLLVGWLGYLKVGSWSETGRLFHSAGFEKTKLVDSFTVCFWKPRSRFAIGGGDGRPLCRRGGS